MTARDLPGFGVVPWSVLCGEGAVFLKSIERRWVSLIDRPGVKESELQKFICDHASLFFGQHLFVISGAELGSDFRVDFVVATDEASYGIDYTFVEIETPQSRVYTRSGDPSARLTHAMQQVRDWKSWLTRHRGVVRRFFPSEYFGWDEFTNLSFCVVIGRRGSPSSQTAKRNILARDSAIKIRSFDHLTDVLRARLSFLSDWGHLDKPTAVQPSTLNQLANPFARAYSWRDWRQVVDRPHFRFSHFVEHNAESLVARRTYSEEYDDFLRWWRSLPARRRARYASQPLCEDSWHKMFVEFGDERHTPP